MLETPEEEPPNGPVEEEREPTEPEPLKLKLPYSTSPWNLANLDAPLFGTDEVAAYSQPQRIDTQGLWNFRPYLSVTTLYDGNVFIEDENSESDFIATISPGVGYHVGNAEAGFSLTANYTASAVLFLNNIEQNSLDHRGSLNLLWAGAKLSVGLQIAFTIDSGTSIDASDRVKRVGVFAGITSHYQYSPKVSFDLSASYRPTRYEALIGSNEARLQGYVNYNFTPKILLGIGGILGVTTVDVGGDQISEEASIRAVYSATEKVTFTGNAGVEFRQFENRAGDTVTPVFGLEAAWAIREGTSLALSARRRIFSSAILENQNYTDTGVSTTLQQRMTEKFDLSLSTGYNNLTYTSVGAGAQASREDSFFYIRPSVQWHVVSWCNIGIFYEYSENFSSGEGARSFKRDRAGLQINIIY